VVKKRMGQFDELVEQRIRTAMAEGHFDGLPGRGRPLALDDDALVPEDLRLAYRVLKNAGYLPEAVQLRSEIGDLERILEKLVDGRERRRANKRLALLRTRLAACGGERPAHLDAAYGARIRRRLAGDP
jgi:hypothetical protein